MPAQIPMDVWALIAQWIVYGASVAGAVTAVAKFITWCRSKTSVAKLERDVAHHKELLDSDNHRLKALESTVLTMTKEQQDNHVILRLLMKGTQATLKNQLGGENTDDIQLVSKEIDEYLNHKI